MSAPENESPVAESRLATRPVAHYVGEMTPSALFHPAVDAWFRKTFPAPTQRRRAPGRRSRRAATCWSPRRPARARRSPRSSPRSTAACAKASTGALPDETPVVYVSPLKALSNDIQRNLEAPLAGIRAELAALGYAGRRDPHAGAHRRHAAERAREHAPAAAAHRRHDAGVAVHAAGLGVGPRDAVDDAHGDRRRDPRARAEQARQPPRAVARAARRADARRRRCASGLSATQKPIEEIARFLVGDDRRPADATARSSTSGTCASATSRSRSRRRRSRR